MGSVTSVGTIGLDLIVNKKLFGKMLGGLKKDAQNAGNSINASFAKPLNGITGMAKKAAGVFAAAFAVTKLVKFGKECLKLGSNLQAVDNIVSVAFPHMTEQVNNFAKSAAQSFGLSETMAKRYTALFGSMSKQFGFSEKQALDMGTTLAALAGDVASFYDMTPDEAYVKLKAVFSGETEVLKDIGVVMTQNALDAYAMANGYGKVVEEMSEAEKVALRYAFIQDQLSAASGDFARTSHSWANQTRVLKLQLDSLKATIGQGFINLFTPIIKSVNTLLGKLGTLANAFKSFTELITGNKAKQGSGIGQLAAEAGTGLANAADSAQNLEDNTSGIGKAAKKAAKEMKALMGFDQINRLEDPKKDEDDNPSFVPDTDFSSGLDLGGLAEGETVLDGLDKKLDGLVKRFKELTKLFKKGFKLGFGDTNLEGLVEQFKRVGKALKEILTDRRVTDAAERIMDQLVETLGVTVGSFARIAVKWGEAILAGIADALERDKEWIIDKLTSIMDTITEILKQIGRIFLTLADIFAAPEVLESLRGLVASITSCLTTAILVIADAAAKIGLAIITGIADSLEKNKQWIIDKLTSIFDTLAQIFDQIKQAFLILGDIFTAPQVLEAIRGLAESITTCLTVIALTVAETAAKIGLAFISGIVDSLEKNKQWLIDTITNLLTAWQGIFNDVTAIILNIGAILTSEDFLGSVQQAAEQITTAFLQVVFAVASVGTTIAENVIGGIKLYLEQNSEFIKDALIGCVNCVGEFSEITGQLADAVADIFSVFSGDNAKQITADLIGIFGNSFFSALELAGKFATDLIDTIAGPIIDNKDKIKEAIDNTLAPVSEVIHTIKESVTEAWTKMQQMYDEHIAPMFQSFKDGISEIVGIVLDGYNKHIAPVLERLADKFKVVWEEHVKPVIDKGIELIGHIADSLKEIWEKTLKPIVKWIAENIMPVIGPILEALGKTFFDVFGTAGDIIGDVLDMLKGLIDFITGVFTLDIDKALGGLGEIFKGFLNGVKDFFGGIWGGIKDFFGGIWDGAKSLFGSSNEEEKTGTPSIPHLATGAYVKPNTPQLAMIGDNKHQGEVVAPEDKLLEMAKTAASMSNNETSENTMLLREILAYLRSVDLVAIEPESLRKYFVKETNKRTMSTGVCELKF